MSLSYLQFSVGRHQCAIAAEAVVHIAHTHTGSERLLSLENSQGSRQFKVKGKLDLKNCAAEQVLSLPPTFFSRSPVVAVICNDESLILLLDPERLLETTDETPFTLD